MATELAASAWGEAVARYAHLAILLLTAAAVLTAAIADLRALIIPNAIILVILLLFPAWVLLAPQMPDLPQHLLSFAIVFAVGMLIFALRWMGGGDVKLLAALALWVGMDDLLLFLLVTALAGGVLSLGYGVQLVLKKRRARRAAVGGLDTGVIHNPRVAVPYGVAIACGGLIVLGKFFWTDALRMVG